MEAGGSSATLGEVRNSKVVHTFIIPLVPEDLMDMYMRLPHAVVRKCGDTIPDKIYWYFPNGDVFEARYCHVRKGFSGTVKVLREYNAQTFGMLTFEYRGSTDFFVSLFDTTGVEHEYPLEARFFPYEPESSSYLSSRSANTGVMVDSINASTLDLNCKKGWGPKIHILITNPRVELTESEQVLMNQNRQPVTYWFDECGVYLSSRHRVWTVYVRKVDKVRTFREGWKTFIEETGVETGDLLILERDGNPFHFQIAICKGYDRLGQSLAGGCNKPMKFIRFVNEAMLTTGEAFMPITFWHKYGYTMEERIHLRTGDGNVFVVGYCRASRKLYALHQLLTQYKIKSPYIMVFRFESVSTMFVAIFAKNRIECLCN